MTILIFLILACIAIMAIRKPPIMVGVAVAIYSFEQWAQVNSSFFVANATFLNLYMGVLTLTCCAKSAFLGNNLLGGARKGHWVFWSLYFYMIASVLWSVNVLQSRVIVVSFLPYLVTVVFLIPVLVQNEKDVKTAVYSILYMGSIVSMMLLFGTRVHDWGRTIVIESGAVMNRRGDEVNRLSPLSVAELSGQAAIVAALLRFRGINSIWNYLKWPVLIVCIIQIFRSGSRGQLFGAAAIVFVFYGMSRTKSKGGQLVRGAIFAIVLGAIGAFIFMSYEALTHTYRWNLSTMAEGFSNTRGALSMALLTYMAENPSRWLFGIGSAGSFDQTVVGFYPHVVPVEILGEGGLVGFSWYLLSLALCAKAFFRLLHIYSEDHEKRSFVVAFGALFAFGFLLSLKQGTFLSSLNFGLFAMLLFQYESIAERFYKKKTAVESYMSWYRLALWRNQMEQAKAQENLSATT